jgi:quercetin dioxygenase-like cupin family protein
LDTRPERLMIAPGEGRTVWLGGVGVVFKVLAEETGGAFSIVEHPVLPGTLVPPHLHHDEDELSYIVDGRFGVRIGDRVLQADPGAYVFKPRGIPHTFWNATDEPARLIEFIWPGGFERFFEELAAAFDAGAGTPDPATINELADRYHTPFVMDWVPELESEHGVSVLHRGGQ